jgi:hypothetical protein
LNLLVDSVMGRANILGFADTAAKIGCTLTPDKKYKSETRPSSVQ